MSIALARRIADEHAAVAGELPAVVSGAARRSALEALAERGLPTSRDENWKYFNLRPLERVRFAPVAVADRPALDGAQLPPPVPGYARYVFVDGRFAPALSAAGPEQGGVRVVSMLEGAAPRHAGVPAPSLDGPDARFALLNEAFFTDGASIAVPEGDPQPACIEVLFVATADAQAGASYPRLEVTVGRGARATLIERHIDAGGGASFANGVVSVTVGRDAAVDHYRLQQLGARSSWIDTLGAELGPGAAYDVCLIHLGGQAARSTLQIRLAGERARLGLYGVSVADRHQVHDIHALAEHTAANATTVQAFRGIAQGRSRVAFNGKVVVRPGAHGTDSNQSLRGLLAGPEAEIDARPQLEIYVDDVRCAHGATAGKLDENMLFYLLSRGLDRDTAQRLLKWAFLEDVVARIGVPELRRQIERSLAGQLQESDSLKELL